MFWSRIAWIYDLFENIYNSRVYKGTGRVVAQEIRKQDLVLECACGTGAITCHLAPKCRKLVATDFAPGMLKQAKKKLAGCSNVSFEQADLTALRFKENTFDVVVAGNVIHLLDDPKQAMTELTRVVKPGGKLIIPTYINNSKETKRWVVTFLEKLGADFKRQFDADSYRAFFRDMGYEDVRYHIVKGRMACDVAVIEVHK